MYIYIAYVHFVIRSGIKTQSNHLTYQIEFGILQ